VTELNQQSTTAAVTGFVLLGCAGVGIFLSMPVVAPVLVDSFGFNSKQVGQFSFVQLASISKVFPILTTVYIVLALLLMHYAASANATGISKYETDNSGSSADQTRFIPLDHILEKRNPDSFPSTAPEYQARLNAADQEPGNWLLHGRNYSEDRFSPLAKINSRNVGRLGYAWSFKFDTRRGLEATPIVRDGVIFVTECMGQNRFCRIWKICRRQ